MAEGGQDGRVVVLGVGNVLMRDDALGPYVIHLLEARYEFPPEVDVVDGGTPGLDFLPYLHNARSVLVVDAVSSKGEAGSIHVYRKDEMLASSLPPRITPHQPGIREALMAAELTESAPAEIVLIGVVPEDLELGTELTSPVQEAVEPVIEIVLEELGRLGAAPRRRGEEIDPEFWWQRDPPP